MKIYNKKNKSGSVLVFSLIMLSLILTSALAIGVATVIERKSSLTSNKSTQGFQVADSAVELVMYQLKNEASLTDISSLAGVLGGGATCSAGIISGNLPGDADKTYSLNFTDNATTPAVITSCSVAVSTIGRVKSVGTFGNTTRAVDAPISGACSGETSITDSRDTNNSTYNTIAIGKQCWLDRNLNVGTVQLFNGDTAPSDDTKIERWCPAPDGTADTVLNSLYTNNCKTDGALYTWHEAVGNPAACYLTPAGAGCKQADAEGVQGICPDGWHVPTDAEWTELTTYLNAQIANRCGGTPTYIAKALASASGWNSLGTTVCDAGNDQATNNSIGFNWTPAGSRTTGGTFSQRGNFGYIWSSSKSGSANWISFLRYTLGTVTRANFANTFGAPVRCIKD